MNLREAIIDDILKNGGDSETGYFLENVELRLAPSTEFMGRL